MWIPIDGRGLTLSQTQIHIDGLDWRPWKPSGMTLHNTAAPRLDQWHAENAAQRIENLVNYFRNERGWSSGPHAFIDDNRIWLFTPFNQKGTHSPSWNGTRLGIEMVGDFNSEDDDSGRGLLVKQNTVALFAMIHARLGIDPDTIKLHKEDPKTTHDCPGRDIDKAEFIDAVKEYMGHGGDHDIQILPIAPAPLTAPKILKRVVVSVAKNDSLTVRGKASASGAVLGALGDGTPVDVTGEALNVSTKWYRIVYGRDGGWISARYTR